MENREEATLSPEDLALGEFVAAWNEGRKPDVTAFCAAHPGCGPELREGIDDYLFLSMGFDLTGAGPAGGDAAHSPGVVLGGFTILREIGRGGMGVVYEAEQQAPKRRVALKVIRPGRSSESTRRRFRREADLLGRLRHPNIAPIFEVGDADVGFGPQPYYAMEYIDGATLLEHTRREDCPDAKKLELLALVCDGVQHAHEHGILHRDLKPGNILVDQTGRPRVLDFGVARVIDERWRGSTLSTETGALIGTLPYMSPEQVRGRPDELDARSDVYALGIIGYELLSGSLPYDLTDRSVPEAARIIGEEQPTPLSAKRKALRGDLDTIFLKALTKEPDRRYESAAALAADLRRYLLNEPIVARPPSAIYQLSRFARRNPALSIAVAALFLVLLVGVVWLNLALSATRKAEALASRNLTDSMQRSAQLSMERGQWHAALETIDELIEKDPGSRAVLGLRRAEALVAVADRDGAQTELEELLARSVGQRIRARALLMMGDLLLDEWARSEEGEALVRQALEQGLDPRDASYARALLAPSMPQAVRLYEEVLERDPLHFLARERLIISLYLLARFDEVRWQCDLLSVLYPQDATPVIAEFMIAALRSDQEPDPELLSRAREQFGEPTIAIFRDLTEVMKVCVSVLEQGPSAGRLGRLAVLVGKLGLAPQQVGDQRGVRASFVWGLAFRNGWGRAPSVVKALLVGDRERAAEIAGEIAEVNPEGTILYLQGLALLRPDSEGGADQFGRDRLAEAALLKSWRTPALFEGVRRLALKQAILIERIHWDPSRPSATKEFRARGVNSIREFLTAGQASWEELLVMVDSAQGFGDFELAREILSREQDTYRDRPAWALQRARVEGLSGAPARALRLLDQALARFPGDASLRAERQRWSKDLRRATDQLLEWTREGAD